ncbi:Os05g0501101 [Oryza sativa Japonica Group]|uniref:Os05g0501101 protein n=1 Tax=Oryza sativa subsp. japonica TaxID=39947 RepID=A0A0P0WP81_ORYSJ|nr:Os05g0501101 [Oryza sativa Japonica Group]
MKKAWFGSYFSTFSTNSKTRIPSNEIAQELAHPDQPIWKRIHLEAEIFSMWILLRWDISCMQHAKQAVGLSAAELSTMILRWRLLNLIVENHKIKRRLYTFAFSENSCWAGGLERDCHQCEARNS